MCDNSELIICVLAAIAAGRTGAVAVSGDTEAITESCVALSALSAAVHLLPARVAVMHWTVGLQQRGR